MNLYERVILYGLLLVVATLVFEVKADDQIDPDQPVQMLLQPMDQLPGFSKLCTMPFQLLNVETGEWDKPTMRCVFIETPDFINTDKNMTCEAVGYEDGYIECGKVS